MNIVFLDAISMGDASLEEIASLEARQNEQG